MLDPRCYFDLNVEPEEPLEEAALRRLEATLGVALPAELVALLRVRNGGVLRYCRFPTAAVAGCDHVALDELGGVGGGGHDLFDVRYLREEWDLPEWAVMLGGDGHTWIALDYRRAGEPGVVWLESSDQDGAGPRVTPLAASFPAFLAGLQLDEPDTCWGSVEPTGVVLEAILAVHRVRLSDRFEASVLPAGAESSGRVRLGSNRGRLDQLVWPEFPAVRSVLMFDIEEAQRPAAAAWVESLALRFQLLHPPPGHRGRLT